MILTLVIIGIGIVVGVVVGVLKVKLWGREYWTPPK